MSHTPLLVGAWHPARVPDASRVLTKESFHVTESAANQRVCGRESDDKVGACRPATVQLNRRVCDQDSDEEDFNDDVDVVGTWDADDQPVPDSPSDDEDTQPLSRLRDRIATLDDEKHNKPQALHPVAPQYYDMDELRHRRITAVGGVEWLVKWTGFIPTWHCEEDLISPNGDCEEIIADYNADVIAIRYNGPGEPDGKTWTCWKPDGNNFQAHTPAPTIRAQDLDRALGNQ